MLFGTTRNYLLLDALYSRHNLIETPVDRLVVRCRLFCPPQILTVNDEGRTIKLEALDVPTPERGCAEKCSVLFLKMNRQVVMERVEQSCLLTVAKIITFELVARMTGINKVVCLIRTTLGFRSKMIKSQFGSYVGLRHLAIATTHHVNRAYQTPNGGANHRDAAISAVLVANSWRRLRSNLDCEGTSSVECNFTSISSRVCS